MKTYVQKIEFLADSLKINGRLHLPPNVKKPPLVVGSHGLEGTKESAKQIVLSKLLPENGIAYLRFDHRGCGNSQGNFVDDTSIDGSETIISDQLKNSSIHFQILQNTPNQPSPKKTAITKASFFIIFSLSCCY